MKNKVIGLFKNASLKNKLIYIYVLGIVLPVIALSIIYCVLAIDKTKDNIKRELDYDLSEIVINIDNCIEQASAASDSIFYDNDLMNVLKSKGKSRKQYIDIAEKIDEIAAYVIRYDFIDDITIYSHNSELYRSGVLRYIDDAKNQDEWYDDFIQGARDFMVLSYADKETGKNKISIIRKLNNTPGVNDILKMDISSGYIAKQLKSSKFESKLTLIDVNKNKVVAEGECIQPCSRYKLRIERNLTFPDNYMLRCDYNPEEVTNQLVVFFIIVLIILLLSMLLMMLLIRPVISKLNLLTSSVENVEHDRFIQISEKGLENDELGTLIRGYNRAVNRIDVLINEVYSENLKRIEIENEKNRAQFKLLMGQLNPHFIFNLFEIMRMNALKDGNREFSRLIYEMSTIIRNIISWKDDLIKLEQEMNVVKSYLDLSNYSFENEMEVVIDVADSLLNCIIPKMSVQILVENAIRHGIENVPYKKKISIRANCNDEKLIISIADNGVGMSSELVEAINNRNFEKTSSSFGIGISNVIERLRIYYGDVASLKVQSIPNKKTEFTLNIPISTKER